VLFQQDTLQELNYLSELLMNSHYSLWIDCMNGCFTVRKYMYRVRGQYIAPISTILLITLYGLFSRRLLWAFSLSPGPTWKPVFEQKKSCLHSRLSEAYPKREVMGNQWQWGDLRRPSPS
jgi:hypothetical protein